MGAMFSTKELETNIKDISVEEKRICVDHTDPCLVPEISIDGIGARQFLKGDNLCFAKIRFEMNLLLSYQSSLDEALNDWPDWRKNQPFKCIYCERLESLPVKITRVERLVIYSEIPGHKEVVGWKVSGAECKAAKCSLIDHREGKRVPIYQWDYIIEGKKMVCKECAERIRESRSKAEFSKYVIF